MSQIKLSQILSKDAWYLIQGETRMFLYTYLPFMVRFKVRRMFEERKVAAKKCLENKSCVFCGCKTPSLFFANKGCGLSKLTPENREIVAGRKSACYPDSSHY